MKPPDAAVVGVIVFGLRLAAFLGTNPLGPDI